ncbi:MAG TPA: isocitrate lyase/phosphoenolpyruvate mutase family protein, partial [Burkholderiales bacterium]|nr:isocitrate lyase/phosphoenolpyruvate mutase family protein [Burkholderiales bacterium]
KAVERAVACVEAGADGIFPEAITTLEMYRTFKDAVKVPILANITEFGKTPLFSVDELRATGTDMVLYPMSACRAMNKAAMLVFEEIKRRGTQKSLLPEMQTREEMYQVIDYHSYEKKLDELFTRGRS